MSSIFLFSSVDRVTDAFYGEINLFDDEQTSACNVQFVSLRLGNGVHWLDCGSSVIEAELYWLDKLVRVYALSGLARQNGSSGFIG